MSQADVQTLRDAYAAVSRGDWDLATRFADPELELQTRLRPRGSSAMMENRIGHLWTMRDGRAIRLQVFRKREDALEAAESPG